MKLAFNATGKLGWRVALGMAILAVCGAVSAGLLALHGHNLRADNKRLLADIRAKDGEISMLYSARNADNAAVTQAASDKVQIRAAAVAKARATEKVLEANADWANQPVPAAVADRVSDQ